MRVEFINPLFIALGWDVLNERGYAKAYKDVVLPTTGAPFSATSTG